tara:strand:- start:96 stop:1565 length:1470 start_codon:yes stop_codon:yes gene_type:complete
MEFFDKKEEVMDIVLTRKGRELYSTGKFTPAYYAFCDDEIIYETEVVSASAGGVHRETQNRTAQRIKDVPRIKLQSGYQTAMGLKGHVTSSLFEPKFRILGRSSNIDEEAPAWHVKVVNEKGLISGSVKFVPTEMSAAFVPAKIGPSSSHDLLRGFPRTGDIYRDISITDEQMLTRYNGEIIPQISVYCDYEVKTADAIGDLLTKEEKIAYDKVLENAKNNNNIESDLALNNFRNMIFQKHGGNKVMLLKKSTDDILLEFKENNVDYSDYSLEVFKYEYNSGNNLVGLKQLKFSEEQHGSDFVEYFFDISTDAEADIDLQIEYVDESLFAGLEEESPSPQCPPGKVPLPTVSQIKPPLSAGSIPAMPPPVQKAGGCSSDGDCDPGFACAPAAGKCYEKKFGAGKGNVVQAGLCKSDSDCYKPLVCVGPNLEYPLPSKYTEGNCYTKPTGKEVEEGGKCNQDGDCAQPDGSYVCCNGICEREAYCQEEGD